MKGGASYHNHTQYCDGQGSVADVVTAALEAGLDEVGITSHAPLPFESDWTMPLERLDRYIREVQEAREKYRGTISVLLGAEIDYIPSNRVIAFQEREILSRPFDYFVGSVHYLGDQTPALTYDESEDTFRRLLFEDYAGDIQVMIEGYYRRYREMLGIPLVKIIGHLDRLKQWNADGKYFSANEPWYREAVEETLQAIATSGHIIELNTGGWRRGLEESYPSPRILMRCRELGIPIVVSSDSHQPREVASEFDRAHLELERLGIEPIRLELAPA